MRLYYNLTDIARKSCMIGLTSIGRIVNDNLHRSASLSTAAAARVGLHTHIHRLLWVALLHCIGIVDCRSRIDSERNCIWNRFDVRQILAPHNGRRRRLSDWTSTDYAAERVFTCCVAFQRGWVVSDRRKELSTDRWPIMSPIYSFRVALQNYFIMRSPQLRPRSNANKHSQEPNNIKMSLSSDCSRRWLPELIQAKPSRENEYYFDTN